MSDIAIAVDFFCGAGGLSEGLKRAAERRGIKLSLTAINHWVTAIDSHSANHPDAVHLCTSIDNVSPKEVAPGGRIRLLIAAPECIHFSTARGGRPMSDQSRASAWCVARWAERLWIDDILIENVPEFQTWGPLDQEGRPIKRLRGQIFLQFVETLRSLDFTVEWRILCCADYGDATTRKRFFLRARKNDPKTGTCKPIRWPEPTHADPKRLAAADLNLFPGLKPWKSARNDVIDWSILGKSIFTRKKRLADNTLKRIYAGFEKHGGPNAAPFLIALRRHVDGLSLDEPIRTIVAGANHHALVEPLVLNITKGGETIAPDGPLPTQTSHQHFATAEPIILPHPRVNEPTKADSLDDPLRTVTATSCDMLLAEPVIFATDQTGSNGSQTRSCADPLGTLTTKTHHMVAEPIVVNMKGQSDATGAGAPLPTQTGSFHQYLAEGFIMGHRQFETGDRSPSEGSSNAPDSLERPLRTITAQNGRGNHLVEPVLIPNFGERDGQDPRSHNVDGPLPTITSHGAGAIVEPVVVDMTHGTKPGDSQSRRVHSVDEPLQTVTCARRGEKAVCEGVTLNSHEADGLIHAWGWRWNGDVVHLAYTPEEWDKLPTVVLADGSLAKLDVLLRMVKPHELQRAHSIPNYILKGTLEDQVRQIGNMVPAGTSEALADSILEDDAEPLKRREEAVA